MDSGDKYIGRMLDERYEILEIIGTGGMSVVYKAVCHVLNRPVAIKMLREDMALDEDFLRRFQAESQAVAQLSHPNIVGIYDVSHTREHEYIVMELIEGVTLKQYMKLKGALSEKETAHFMIQVCKALNHAHSRGIVHRDIKPHNIMISKTDGSVKVADFGIARLVDSQFTKVTETLGSVHYISPEQAKAEAVDERTDIYSAGVMMYEMLTGVLPYDGDTPVAVAMKHINGNPLRPSDLVDDLSEVLEAITMKAMEPEKEYRYESAEEMLMDLEYYRKISSEGEDQPEPSKKGYIIYRNVKPIRQSGELTRDGYKRRRSRAVKVSMLSGFLCVMVFVLAVGIFLWDYWLKDIFVKTERFYVPNFVGSDYLDVINNSAYQEVFRFTVSHVPSSDKAERIIMQQSPDAGASLSATQELISIELSVSSGETSVEVPDIYNMEYRNAVNQLNKLGLKSTTDQMYSNSITKDYVVSTVPGAGETVAVGSTVVIMVSKGPEVLPVTMPLLIGMTQNQAKDKVESLNLNLGEITNKESTEPVGTVISQDPAAGTQLEERGKVYIEVSAGPAQEPSPPLEHGSGTEADGG